MKKSTTINTHMRKKIARFFSSRPKVKSVVLFGSRARGDAEERSDIDLSISTPLSTKQEWVELWISLKEDFDSLIPIDAVRWEEASSALKGKIKREGQTIYARR